jgi:hypothetical protein
VVCVLQRAVGGSLSFTRLIRCERRCSSRFWPQKDGIDYTGVHGACGGPGAGRPSGQGHTACCGLGLRLQARHQGTPSLSPGR